MVIQSFADRVRGASVSGYGSQRDCRWGGLSRLGAACNDLGLSFMVETDLIKSNLNCLGNNVLSVLSQMAKQKGNVCCCR